MLTRRILILTPVCLIILLLQSYFWVPTYEQQTRGNPDRFNEYFTASIGDATLSETTIHPFEIDSAVRMGNGSSVPTIRKKSTGQHFVKLLARNPFFQMTRTRMNIKDPFPETG